MTDSDGKNLPAVGLAICAGFGPPIATIAPDGSVSVDWAAAEAAAKEPLPGSLLGTIARVMIAIRGGTAKAAPSIKSSGKE